MEEIRARLQLAGDPRVLKTLIRELNVRYVRSMPRSISISHNSSYEVLRIDIVDIVEVIV